MRVNRDNSDPSDDSRVNCMSKISNGQQDEPLHQAYPTAAASEMISKSGYNEGSLPLLGTPHYRDPLLRLPHQCGHDFPISTRS